MPEAPTPAADVARIAALRGLNILDTPPDERFDRITRLAQRVFDVPIALVGLIDANRQWFKSCRGLSASEMPRSLSFCAYTILEDKPLVVPDARRDPRVADNPLVTGETGLRFYAGQPLHGPGNHRVGTLCIADTRPRELTAQDLETLQDLAAWAETELNSAELGRALKERRGSAARLALQLTFTNAITRSLGEGVYALDAEGRLTFMNPAAEEALGWTVAELRGRSVHETIHFQRPDGSPFPEEECPLLQVLDSGQTVRIEDDAFTRRDGTMFHVAYTCAPIVNEGQVGGAVLAFRDMTEQRRAREALQRQAELLDLANDAIFVKELGTGAIQFWNAGAAAMYGWTREEAVDRVSHSLLRTRFPEPLEEIDSQVVRSGHWEGDLVHSTRDGREIIVASRWALQRDERGEAAAIMEINTDITQRKRTEQRLAELVTELEVQYREADLARGQIAAVLDATSEAMILISPSRMVLSVNRRFADMFAIDPAAVLGREFYEFKDHIERVFADPEDFAARVAGSARDTERQFAGIVLQRWPERRELQMFSTPVRSREGVYLGRLYVLRDVTREREVDRMKTEFVSMVSHELRTPLTSIKGYIDLVLEGEAGEVSGEQGEFLRIVKNNADRLVALVNDLLDVSRIEAGKIQLNRQPLDLISLIRNVSTSLRPALDGKVQHLALDLPPALPSTLGDPDRVTQILTNLLSNAHKYTPQGGRIRIAVRPEPGQLRVDVEDTGVGLSPEEQQQVFTRFFRARNRATQQVGGTGLGLAITRSLVEMHGGEITLSSAPGNGSTFSFTLPTTEQAIEPAGPTPAPPRGGRILVVDDEPDIAQLIRRYLERAGYEVLVAHGGADALDVAQVERPDLITLDIVLPDMDGFTVLERLGSQPDTASIPVVLLSMLGDSGRGKLLGAIDYLTKPVRDSVLLHRVAAILSASRSRLVLVADDEAEVRVIIARHLRQAGYEVVEAADGAEAIEMAKRHLPGLALIDVKMPRMDGVAALRALRADEATRDIAVIVMTASAGVSGESQRAVEGLGGLFVQGKPLTPEELAASIAHCLRDEASPPSHADG